MLRCLLMVFGGFFRQVALKGLLADTGAQAINAMLADASKRQEGIVATIIGVATLIFAAIGVVVQLKDALNTV
jgi:membrane protein